MTDQAATHTRRLAWLIGLLFLLVPLPFFSLYENDNVMSRLMLTEAIVDHGRTSINAETAQLTVDIARHEGVYYSDKAPGMTFLALPTYAAAKYVLGQNGITLRLFPGATGHTETPDEAVARMVTFRLIVLLSSGVLTAIAAGAFFAFAMDLTGRHSVAALATCTVFFGTPLLGWSVHFFGHAATAATLFLAFFTVWRMEPEAPGRWPFILAALAGALMGLTITLEYVAAPAVALVGGYALWKLRKTSLTRGVLLLCAALGAVAVSIVPLLVYHTITFGGPFNVGYASVVGFEGMKEGFMGLTYPRLYVIYYIIFEIRRGILWISPVLVLAPIALAMALYRGPNRPEMVTGGLVLSYYILLNASYFYWEGGASLGPRHTTPAIAFAGIPLIWLWAHARDWLRYVLIGLTGLSVALSLAAASVSMTTQGRHPRPLFDPILSSVFSGETWLAWYANIGLSQMAVLVIWGVPTLALAAPHLATGG